MREGKRESTSTEDEEKVGRVKEGGRRVEFDDLMRGSYLSTHCVGIYASLMPETVLFAKTALEIWCLVIF